jgi:pantoate--beta-alanine ligase
MREWTAAARRQSRSVACVPTMGALHAGHGALIDRARAASDVVVVTIFVNPIQFDRKEDYDAYARHLPADRKFCERQGVDIIFAPTAGEMYPAPPATFVDAPDVARNLCGAFRPGHFRGVATVVAKLFNIVQPAAAYFGEKDAQQLAVIQQMVTDLNWPIAIIPVPTIRESDGLAMSSRNQRLDPEHRQAAPILYKALTAGQRAIASGERDSRAVREAILQVLATESEIRTEYVEAVNTQMELISTISDDARLVAAIWLGSTRLIDNVAVHLTA